MHLRMYVLISKRQSPFAPLFDLQIKIDHGSAAVTSSANTQCFIASACFVMMFGTRHPTFSPWT